MVKKAQHPLTIVTKADAAMAESELVADADDQVATRRRSEIL